MYGLAVNDLGWRLNSTPSGHAISPNAIEKLHGSLTALRPWRARLYPQETPVMFRCPVTFDGTTDMAILGFGRRRTPEPGKHIVPPELWDVPESAAFFARIGAKPDDPNNLRVTHGDVVRMIEEGRKAVDARIRHLRAKALAQGHDNLHLRALWLLHDNCWNGEAGDFLIYHLGLNPYDEWNTMIVAEDARTASILDIPICTEGIVQHLAKTGQPLILGLRDKLRAAHEEVQRTHEFGRFQDAYDDTVAKVKRVAQMFGTGLVETYQAWLRKEADGRSTPR